MDEQFSFNTELLLKVHLSLIDSSADIGACGVGKLFTIDVFVVVLVVDSVVATVDDDDDDGVASITAMNVFCRILVLVLLLLPLLLLLLIVRIANPHWKCK